MSYLDNDNSNKRDSYNKVDKHHHHHHHHHHHSKKRPSTDHHNRRHNESNEEVALSNGTRSDHFKETSWQHRKKEQDYHDRHVLESYSEYRKTPHGSTQLVYTGTFYLKNCI